MKKHILGFGIFSFIFASFAIAFAYFYAQPIPQIGEVRSPIYKSEPQSSCWKSNKKSDDLQYEVISSQYFYGQNKMVSQIKLTWNGYRDAPQKINIVAMYASNGESEKTSDGKSHFFENPFFESNSAIVTIISDFSDEIKFNRKKNLYAYFTIFDENSETNNSNTFVSLKPMPVTFVHNGGFGSGIGYGSGSGSGTLR